MSPPMITNSINTGAIIVRHREYIGDITSSTGFLNRNFPINPGMVGTFPWLAQIANAFEQYRFRGLLFEFKSLSADSLISTSTNIGQGTVIMATQYNALSPGFSTKIEMENYEFANSCKPSCSFIHPVECAMYQTPNTPLYVRNSAIPPNSDERLYDLGNFNLATQGLPSADGSIGELWATFEIEFFKPKYNPNSAEGLGMDRFQAGPGNLIPDSPGFITLTGTAPFGDLTNGYFAGNIGCALEYFALGGGLGNAIRIKFPPNTTEVGERFWISYFVATNSTVGGSQQSINCAYQGCKPSPTMWASVPITSADSALDQMDNNTVAAGQSRKIIFQAIVEIIDFQVTPTNDRWIQLGGFVARFFADFDGIANIFVVKLPTKEVIDPMHSSNLTTFGTDI